MEKPSSTGCYNRQILHGEASVKRAGISQPAWSISLIACNGCTLAYHLYLTAGSLSQYYFPQYMRYYHDAHGFLSHEMEQL